MNQDLINEGDFIKYFGIERSTQKVPTLMSPFEYKG